MFYQRLCEGTTATKGTLVPYNDDIYNHVTDLDKPWYRSLYQYNDEQFKKFLKTKTVSGIKDTTTDRLVFDFDSKEDLELARQDAGELCSRLANHGIPLDDLMICFSGMKGFTVELKIDKRLSPSEFYNIVYALAYDLATFDTSVKDANRVIRVPLTKHDKTNFYKTPITLSELNEQPIEVIKEIAKSNNVDWDRFSWQPVALSESIYKLKDKKEKPIDVTVVYDTNELDFSSKPKGLTNCKFALLNGFFEQGDRSNALTALASTLKYNGYPKETVYGMLKSAARMQAERTGGEVFPKSEIWTNVINQVFGPHWKGGQYSCKSGKDLWLTKICESLGEHKCKHVETPFNEVGEVFNLFKDYALNIDKNTIKTGIEKLDEKVALTIGTSNYLLGGPGSGKTSLALTVLNNTSLIELPSLFVSLDMHPALIAQKKLLKHTDYTSDRLFDIFKHDSKEQHRLMDVLRQEYANVNYSFRLGQTVNDIKDSIIRCEQESGKKIKLVLIDYLECLQGPYSDATANSGYIANQLKDLAIELSTCVITLVQPQKSAGDVSTPLESYRKVKGSSILEQAASIILTIFREGFSPGSPERDKFLTICAVKNRMGEIFKLDYGWDGRRGEIYELDRQGERDLAALREEVEERKKQERTNGGWTQ